MQINQQTGIVECEVTFPGIEKPLRVLRTLHADSTITSSNLARIFWMEGRCTEAVTVWRGILAKDNENPGATLGLLWATDDVTFTHPVRIAEFAYQKGKKSGSPDLALWWYERSLAINPNREATEAAVRYYVAVGDTDSAVAAWRTLAGSLSRNDADYWWAVGQAAELQEDWEASAQAYERGSQITTITPYDYWMRAGWSWEKLKKWEKAEFYYKSALEIRKDLINPYIRLGDVYRYQGLYDQAFAWYFEAQRVDPTSHDPLYRLGHLFLQQHDLTQAQAYLDQALAIKPDNPWIVYDLAQIQYQNGYVEEAIALFNQAIALQAAPPWRWGLELGDWYLDAGQKESALSAYRQAREWGALESDVEERLQRITP
ncbi:MAG: tetratricopeptide repeat protein [Anaerolineae bacterium]|nr:tetratricopeptide repeat protein [Anaerolineae bacterium]